MSTYFRATVTVEKRDLHDEVLWAMTTTARVSRSDNPIHDREQALDAIEGALSEFRDARTSKGKHA